MNWNTIQRQVICNTIQYNTPALRGSFLPVLSRYILATIIFNHSIVKTNILHMVVIKTDQLISDFCEIISKTIAKKDA